MKRKLKVALILVLLVLTIFIFSNQTMAFDWKSQMTTMAKTGVTGTAGDSAKNIVGSIIDIVRIVSLGIALVMLIVIAMKYMVSAPGDRADIKKHAVVYVVGAVILFATTGILSIIKLFAESI